MTVRRVAVILEECLASIGWDDDEIGECDEDAVARNPSSATQIRLVGRRGTHRVRPGRVLLTEFVDRHGVVRGD